MARVILMHPPLTNDEMFVRGSMDSASHLPPLGLAYIASYLQQFGHECRILDCLTERVTVDTAVNIATGYDVVGITVVSTYAVRAIELREPLLITPATRDFPKFFVSV